MLYLESTSVVAGDGDGELDGDDIGIWQGWDDSGFARKSVEIFVSGQMQSELEIQYSQ